MKTKLIYIISIASLILYLSLFSAFSQTNLEIVWQKNIFPTEISFAKFSADGLFIYYAVGNNILKMSAMTGDFVSTFDNTGIPGGINTMEISVRGNYIVTHATGTVTIWDTRLEKAIKHINFSKKPGYDGALAVDISPNEDYIIANVSEYIDFNKSKSYLTVYDFKEDKEIQRIDFGLGTTRNIKISHDGKYFVTGTYYQNSNTQKFYDKLILWETGTWKQTAVLEDIGEHVSAEGYTQIKFSNDDKFIGSLTRNPRVVHIFDLTKQSIVKTSDISKSSINFEFLPDSLYLAFSYDSLQFFTLPDFKIAGGFNLYCWGIASSIINKHIFIFGSDTVYLLNQKTTDVEHTQNKLDIQIYSQYNKVILFMGDLIENNIDIIITDILGKIIYTETIINPQQNSNITLKSELPTGIYICKVIACYKEYTQKIVIVR